MARSLTGAMIGEITAKELRPIYLFEGLFDSAPVRLWTGTGTLGYDGKTWTGAGDLLAVTGLRETQEIAATGITVSLNLANPALVTLALNEPMEGRVLNIWLAALSPGGAVIADPIQVYHGAFDRPTITDGGAQGQISVTADSVMAKLFDVNERRHTDEDQNDEYPGDSFFAHVQDQDRQIVWKGSG